MEYNLKKIVPEKHYGELLKAYYIFYEKLYGKSPLNFLINRKLNNGELPSNAYGMLDGNYGLALDTLKDKHCLATFIGAFDDRNVLSAVSRVRSVVENNSIYACISEIIPLVNNNPHLKEDVIKAFEGKYISWDSADFISFEVPLNDTDLQSSLLYMDYKCILPKEIHSTILFDKPLKRDISLK